jgi:hypothetical protein
MIMVGLGDVRFDATEPDAVTIARYQDLVNTINAGKKAEARVVTATLTPLKSTLIAEWGPVDGLTGYNHWLAMNAAITGTGGNPVTGMVASVNEHTDLITEDGSLKSIYDCGDHIHENNLARQLIARCWHSVLAGVGFFPDERPCPSRIAR